MHQFDIQRLDTIIIIVYLMGIDRIVIQKVQIFGDH